MIKKNRRMTRKGPDYEAYEKAKGELDKLLLTPQERDFRIRMIAKRYRV